MFIIVGLGNPGEKQAGTRHNVGFMIVDEIVRRFDWRWHKWGRHQALESSPPKFKHLLVKPQPFMNRSGETIKALQKEYPSRLETFVKKLIVVHDDLDLPLGTMRIHRGRSSAGHHGVESIIKSLGSDQFWRVRIGIGRPLSKGLALDQYVLGPFNQSEKILLSRVIQTAADWLTTRIGASQLKTETIRVR